MTNRDDRDMRMRGDRYGMRNDRDRDDDRYGMRNDRDRDDDRYGMRGDDFRRSSDFRGYDMNDRDRSGMDRGYRGGLGDREMTGTAYGTGRVTGGMGYGDQGMGRRDESYGYDSGQSTRSDQRGYGDQYGLGYGASDRAGGYGDQFGGLRYGGGSTMGQTGSRSAGGMQGQHYGRGPRNYQRSDERIREDVNEQLTYHHDIDASDIDVMVQNGEVTLTGTVEDRRAKRLAEDIAEQVRGVRDVHNQLKVKNGGLLGAISNMFGTNDDQDRNSDVQSNTR